MGKGFVLKLTLLKIMLDFFDQKREEGKRERIKIKAQALKNGSENGINCVLCVCYTTRNVYWQSKYGWNANKRMLRDFQGPVLKCIKPKAAKIAKYIYFVKEGAAVAFPLSYRRSAYKSIRLSRDVCVCVLIIIIVSARSRTMELPSSPLLTCIYFILHLSWLFCIHHGRK